jgi:hypothetical protein
MLSFASHQLSERQVWALGRLASRVVGLDLAERRDALRGSTLSAPDFPKAQRTRALTIVKAKKTEKRSSSQDTHARAVGSAAALAIDADDATSVARLANLIFAISIA